jgi:hypothetical protein
MSAATDWKAQLAKFIKIAAAADPELEKFAKANVAAIESAVAGRGPDASTAEPQAGARMVVNIAAVHVPAFCEASRRKEPKPYKNGYDLGNYRIGDPPPGESLKSREIVDRALPLQNKQRADNVYFGAVELNGAGIRFYGDVCLVLDRDALPGDTTVILDRNSYDLIRAPIREAISGKSPELQDQARKDEALKLRGIWDRDLGTMTGLKTLQALGLRARRYTTGQISEAVRDDEDYMEVLKIDSFGTDRLQEARISAAEAAHDALTGDRLRSRCAPRMEALIWRERRRRAEEELRRNRVRVRVVTTSGRTKD